LVSLAFSSACLLDLSAASCADLALSAASLAALALASASLAALPALIDFSLFLTISSKFESEKEIFELKVV